MLSKKSSEFPFIVGVALLVLMFWCIIFSMIFDLFLISFIFIDIGGLTKSYYSNTDFIVKGVSSFIFTFLTGYLILRGILNLIIKREVNKIISFLRPTKKKIISSFILSSYFMLHVLVNPFLFIFALIGSYLTSCLLFYVFSELKRKSQQTDPSTVA